MKPGMKKPQNLWTLCALWGSALLTLAVILGCLVTVWPQNRIDYWWNTLSTLPSDSTAVDISRALDWLGGGLVGVYVVPVAIAVVLMILRGWQASVFAIATFAFSALLVQIAKSVFDRARPEEVMVAVDHGSFPSGHTANAATIVVVLAVIFWQQRKTRLAVISCGVVYVLLMALSRTVLSAHWMTDTIGGALIGLAAGLYCTGLYARLYTRTATRTIES